MRWERSVLRPRNDLAGLKSANANRLISEISTYLLQQSHNVQLADPPSILASARAADIPPTIDSMRGGTGRF